MTLGEGRRAPRGNTTAWIARVEFGWRTVCVDIRKNAHGWVLRPVQAWDSLFSKFLYFIEFLYGFLILLVSY